MRNKFFNLLRRSPRNDPPADLVQRLLDSFMAKVAEASRQNDLGASYFSPVEAGRIFDLFQNVWLDVVLRRYPAFDIAKLRAEQPELFWPVIERRVQAFRLREPIRAEVLQAMLLDYGDALANAALIQANLTNSAKED